MVSIMNRKQIYVHFMSEDLSSNLMENTHAYYQYNILITLPLKFADFDFLVRIDTVLEISCGLIFKS